jgi:hypothetical protein
VRKLWVGIATMVLALAPLLANAQAAKGGEPLGMVIDVQGKGTITDAGKKAPLEMLAYLKPAAEIQLEPGASITVTWYEGSKELSFKGPARLKVEPKGIQVASGKPAQERAVSDDKVEATRKLPPRLGQAAISMRGLKPMTPEQEARREKLRPADNAPFADWVVFAMGLEQMGLTGEAKGVWRKLAEQRPDDPKLKELAK